LTTRSARCTRPTSRPLAGGKHLSAGTSPGRWSVCGASRPHEISRQGGEGYAPSTRRGCAVPRRIRLLLTTLVVVATPGTGAVYSIAAGLSRGSRADIIAALGMPVRFSSRMPASGWSSDSRHGRSPAAAGYPDDRHSPRWMRSSRRCRSSECSRGSDHRVRVDSTRLRPSVGDILANARPAPSAFAARSPSCHPSRSPFGVAPVWMRH
jgi:hypothetical protein